MILGTFVKKHCFFNDILLSYQFPLVRPSCELGLPKCLPNASQMSPKCFPDASKMPLRWLSDAFQIPDASQMPPKSCSIAFSSMILLHRSHSAMMTKDSSDMNDVFSSMILLHWPLFHDSSSWFRKTCLGSRAGVILISYLLDLFNYISLIILDYISVRARGCKFLGPGPGPGP